MAYQGFKGIGPRGLGAKKGGNEGVGSVHYWDSVDNSDTKHPVEGNAASYDGLHNTPLKKDGAMKGDQSATHTDYKNFKDTDPNYHGHSGSSHGDQSATHEDYVTSPGKKMNKGMSYDIKEASNQNLSASARKHYAENAQAAQKGGYGDKEHGN